MSASDEEGRLGYVMDSLEAEWRLVQPPDFWSTVRDAKWPGFGPEADELLIQDSSENLFVRMWVDSIGANAFREPNNAELSPFIRVMTAYIIKGSSDTQRQMAAATADTQHLYLGNSERKHPSYSGENKWGLFTAQAAGFPIQWRFPKIGGAYGIGIVWSAWDIGYRSPYPKG